MPAATGTKRLIQALLWFVLGLPLAIQTWRFGTEAIYYGEYLHWSGQWAARLLLVTLLVTAFKRYLPRLAVTRWMLGRRRDLGLITFAYALAHTLAYVFYKAEFALIIREGMEWGLLTGWVAGLVFVALAVTSNDVSVRRLGRRWQWLHRTVYVAAILTFAHWVLTAFDPTAGWQHATVLAVIVVLRIWPRARRSTSDQIKNGT